MRARRASITLGMAAACLVTLVGQPPGAVAAPPAGTARLPAAAAPRSQRAVPDAPTVHVPTSADVLPTQASMVHAARSAGVVPRIPVDTTGFSYVVLGDVNNRGTAVGYGARSDYKGASRELLLVHRGVTEVVGRAPLPDPIGDRSSFANAINDDGIVTGVAPCQCNRVPPGVPASVAFRWSRRAGFSAAPMPPGVVASTGVSINDEGQILLNTWASPSPSDDGAWIWDPSRHSLERLPDLGQGPATGTAINNDGTVVGFVGYGQTTHAVMWKGRHHRITDLSSSGAGASQATDINQDGTIVGWQGTHAVAWLNNGHKVRDLGEGKAFAVNDDDQVAGNVTLAHITPDDGGATADVTVAAVYDLWDRSRRTVLDTDQLVDWSPTRLNDDGLVVNWMTLFGPARLR